MKRVLFLCSGNSARSQMAEGLANRMLAGTWEAVSAGTRPAGHVHPLAVRAMDELGIDIRTQRSKSVDVFRGADLDLVVTLCDSAAQECPVWLGKGRVEHVDLPDPAAAEGTEEERLEAFRRVRDAIRRRVVEPMAEGRW